MGRHVTLGPIVVSERDISSSDDGLFDAFVVHDRVTKRFNANGLRKLIQPKGMTQEQAVEVLDAYVTINHQNYLRKVGKPSASLRPAERSSGRNTHCFRCKTHLESGSHFECSACGWLVCTCGACGCGSTYNKGQQP